MKSINGDSRQRAWPLARQMAVLLLAAATLLAVPLVAMQFTQEVNWDGLDFALAGALLVGVGSAYVLGARLLRHGRARLLLGLLLGLLLLLVWGELAVGILGTPLAGS